MVEIENAGPIKLIFFLLRDMCGIIGLLLAETDANGESWTDFYGRKSAKSHFGLTALITTPLLLYSHLNNLNPQPSQPNAV